MSPAVRAWLARNTAPIVMVLVAAALVIAATEGLDAIGGSGAAPAADAAAEGGLEGALTVAALLKPLLFLAVGAGATFGVRRLARRRAVTTKARQEG